MKYNFRKLNCVLFDRATLYLILVLAFYCGISEICRNITVDCSNDLTIFLQRLSTAMLLAMPLLFCRKKRLVFPYLFLVNLYFISIVLYLRTYASIMPLSSYLMIQNLDGLGLCILDAIKIRDILLILPSLCFSLLYVFVCKKADWIFCSRYKLLIVSLLLSIGILLDARKPFHRCYYEKLSHYYGLEPLQAFKEYGLIHFWIFQIEIYRGTSAEEEMCATEFMKRLSFKSNCAGKITETNKNLLLILVESLQSWPIGLSVDGIEVTPHINRLLKMEQTVGFLKEIPQVKDGRSSDAQLIINTGILPLRMGAASGLCGGNRFPSLSNALKKRKYTTVSFLCDHRNYWNQETMLIAYDFDQLYDCLKGDDGMEKADENLFRKAAPILAQLQQPFYAQLVTFSSHASYQQPLVESSLKNVTTLDCEVRNYLIAVQYADKCIGEFLEKLKHIGLYDNSVIVITGDHDAMSFNRYEGREELRGEDFFVPFIILNSPLSSKHTDKVIGQIDLYPSLLDVMGCSDYFFTGVGESLFCDSISNFATYKTGIAAGGENVPNSVKEYRKECWKISDILLRMDYFRIGQQLVDQYTRKRNP